ncbi:MAG: methyl-accepting chemotaxis protein [Phormidesmis sp.]
MTYQKDISASASVDSASTPEPASNGFSTTPVVPPSASPVLSSATVPRWRTVRGRATLIAIALGTIPVIIIGGVATFLASNQISQDVIKQQEQIAETINLDLQTFVSARLNDVQAIATNPLIFNPDVRAETEPQTILEYVNSYVERDPSYSAIAAAEPDGRYFFLDPTTSVLVGEERPEAAEDPTDNIFADRNVPYFLAVRDSLEPSVSPIRISSVTGDSSFYVAVPAFNQLDNQFLGVVYSRTDAADLANRLAQDLQLVLSDGEGTDVSVLDSLKFDVIDHTPAYYEKDEEGQDKEIVSTRIQLDGDNAVIDGQPFQPGGEVTRKDNRVFISENNEGIGESAETLFPSYAELRESESITTRTITSPQDNQSYLVTYVPIAQTADLGQDWGVLVYEPTATAFAARRTLLLTLLGGTAIAALLAGLLANFLANRAMKPITEATEAVTKLGQGDLDVRLAVTGEDEFAILSSNINTMADRLQELLARLEESAQEQGVAQAQSEIAAEQQKQREVMQQELIGLIRAVEGASEGDLTVRAELSTGEIGIVADVFNSIVESLRKIVVQVKQATTQVNTSIGSNQESVRLLADNALSQVDEVSNTLTSVQQMTASIQSVAESAQQAATVARDASSTAKKGGQAMDQTVDSILGLRSTVAETTKKVKQLGEASQQISQVVALINEIALKTNLLAVNASIEAAHAGEEGQGFAVVAGEVGELAEQSAAATKEIERIVRNIQDGTKDVVEAMELSTSQVVEGTTKLSETKESLEQILTVSDQIDKLVKSISEATESQASTSQTVTKLMEQITAASQQTSVFSKQVDGALQGTVEVAQELEAAIDKFTVGSDPA